MGGGGGVFIYARVEISFSGVRQFFKRDNKNLRLKCQNHGLPEVSCINWGASQHYKIPVISSPTRIFLISPVGQGDGNR